MDSWSGTELTRDFSLHLSHTHKGLLLWYSLVCTHDWISTAFGTLHRQVKYSTGYSPSPLSQQHASWISFNYITCIETWHILYLLCCIINYQQQIKEPKHKETVLFVAVGHILFFFFFFKSNLIWLLTEFWCLTANAAAHHLHNTVNAHD